MALDRYYKDANSIMSEAEQDWASVEGYLRQYTPQVQREKRQQAVVEIEAKTLPKLDALEKRIQADAEKADADMFAYRFPYSVEPKTYETPDEKRQREQARLEAVQVAYTMPMYDAGLFQRLLSEGLNQTAFTYYERVNKADPKPADGASREVWNNETQAILKRQEKYGEIQSRREDAHSGLARIQRLKPLVASGSYNVKLLNSSQLIDRMM